MQSKSCLAKAVYAEHPFTAWWFFHLLLTEFTVHSIGTEEVHNCHVSMTSLT